MPCLEATPPGLPEVRVGQHHALRPACRAAGVDERREVVVGARHDRDRVGLRGPIELLGRDHPLRAGGIHRLVKGGRGDHERGLAVGDDAPQLGGRDEEDHRRDDRPCPRERVVDDGDVRRVLHQHDHSVAGLDLEPGSEPARTLEELAGGMPGALEPECGVVAAALEDLLGEPGEVARAEPRHSVRMDCPPACCIAAIIPAGEAPSGRRWRSSSRIASGSQPVSLAKSSPACQPWSMFTEPP